MEEEKGPHRRGSGFDVEKIHKPCVPKILAQAGEIEDVEEPQADSPKDVALALKLGPQTGVGPRTGRHGLPRGK